jgi:hypothetical protein
LKSGFPHHSRCWQRMLWPNERPPKSICQETGLGSRIHKLASSRRP